MSPTATKVVKEEVILKKPLENTLQENANGNETPVDDLDGEENDDGEDGVGPVPGECFQLSMTMPEVDH